jgi:membrane associated rhomboid family serine protease
MIPIKDVIPARRFPLVNWIIILANVAVFLFEASIGSGELSRLIGRYGMVPARMLSNPGVSTGVSVFTSMFLHGGWFHLISNMWALYIFGDNVEDRLGPMRYLLFYLVCGVVAALAYVYSQPLSNVPVVGASGAISGVLGAYLVLYPRARVISLVPLWIVPWFIEIPAVFYLGFWFFSQLFSGLLSLGMPISTYGGVAWWAHVGGFIAGLLLVKILEQKRTYPRWHLDEYHPW